MSTTAIIGAGVMGETLLSGLIRAGRPARDLLIGEKRPERARELEERYDVSVVSNLDATKRADTIALVVKPQDMASVLEEIGPAVRPGQLVVSLAAGITTSFLESRLPDGVPVVRVMPNTPAQVGEAMSAWVASAAVTPAQCAQVRRLLGALGREIAMTEEDALDQVTAVSGSGPAYLFYLAEQLIESGRAIGLSEDDARELVLQTIWGAAKMLRQGTVAPGTLRQAVTSKGGTTEAALKVFADEKLAERFAKALAAAARRGGELGDELAKG